MTINIQIGIAFILLLSELSAQTRISDAGSIVSSTGGQAVPIVITSNDQNVLKLATAAFSTHGGYRLLADKGGQYLFELQPGGEDSLALRIYTGDRATLYYEHRVKGPDLAAITLKACDIAVQKTLGIPGYFSGRIAFVGEQSGSREIWLGDLFFSAPKRITSDRSDSLNPSLSPDGRYLIYTSFYKTGFPDLFKIDLKTGSREVFANFKGTNMGGVFSPNGRTVASIFSSTGNQELWISDLNCGSLKRLTKNKSAEVSPAWSPDGKRIVITSDSAGSPQLYIVPAKGGQMQRVPTQISSYCAEPDWNPVHANLIAFTAAVAGRFQIAVYDFNEGRSEWVTEFEGDCVEPCWTNDGRHLIFTRKNGAEKSLWIIDTQTKQSKRLHAASFGAASQADFVY